MAKGILIGPKKINPIIANRTSNTAVIIPDLGDLSILVREEGYKGEFFNPESTESLAKAIKAILNDDDYRRKLATTNYKAACELSMDKIVQMYIRDFKQLNYDKILRWVNG